MTQTDILNENPWPVIGLVVSILLVYYIAKYLARKLDNFKPEEVPPRKPEERPEPVEYFNDWAEHIAKEARKPKYYKGKAGALNGNAKTEKKGAKK
jgi:hypothetical protein